MMLACKEYVNHIFFHRILKLFEDVASIYIGQIPKNSSQPTSFVSLVLVAEKVNNYTIPTCYIITTFPNFLIS